jgi:predicted DNA-binding transcriptional regulator YafY
MRKYPTMTEIIDACIEKLDFEPARETIQKDLANMRLPYPDGFDAPVRYCPRRKGYEYTDPNYSLAGVSLRQEELDVITDAVDFIQALGGTRISHQFNNAVEKLLSATKERKIQPI